MPCDSQITITMELDKARAEVLDDAMKTLGFRKSAVDGSWVRNDGITAWRSQSGFQVTGSRYGFDQERIKSEIMRATSTEIVKRAAAKNGWQLRTTGESRFQAVRMTYGSGR